MALFNNFPWTNFHELNLDWIVHQVKEIQAAFPEGLVGVVKGGTGANNAADARANLGVYASEIDMAPDDSRVISLVMGYLEDRIEAVEENVNYRIFKTVQDLGLTPGSVSIASTWTAMSSGDVVLCPPDEFTPGSCPESYGSLLLIRSGGNSGACLFFGESHQYRKNFVSNYPTGSWEQVYTDGDIVPITNGGTGADNATDAIQNLGIDFSGTVLSVAGVGADPTGNVPLTAEDLDVKIKLYTSIQDTDIGLPVGSTINAVWNAMPSDSRIVFPQSEISNPPVAGAGVIDICKTGPGNNLGWILYFGQQKSTGNYQMYLNSSGIPTGEWIDTANGVTLLEDPDGLTTGTMSAALGDFERIKITWGPANKTVFFTEEMNTQHEDDVYFPMSYQTEGSLNGNIYITQMRIHLDNTSMTTDRNYQITLGATTLSSVDGTGRVFKIQGFYK